MANNNLYAGPLWQITTYFLDSWNLAKFQKNCTHDICQYFTFLKDADWAHEPYEDIVIQS